MNLKTALLISAAILTGCGSNTKETELTFEETPLAVRLGIEKAFPDAKVQEIEKEVHKDDGIVHYEVELTTSDGDHKEARFTPDGELVLKH